MHTEAETWGEWGDGPPKFELAGRPMHWSPNIWRSSVVGCVRKDEQSKKMVLWFY